MMWLKSGTSGRTVGVGTGLDVCEGTAVDVAVGRGEADGGIVSVIGRLVAVMGVHATKPDIRKEKKIVTTLRIIENLLYNGNRFPSQKEDYYLFG
jgi:hypothetical protein